MMFDKNYKRAMDNIVPSDDAVTKTLDSMRKANSEKKSITKNRFKIIAIACLAVVIVTTSVFAAFKFSGVSEPVELSGIRQAKGYEDIDKIVKELYKLDLKDWFVKTEDAAVELERVEQAIPEIYDSTATDVNQKYDSTQNDKEFSDTNNQVLGVQEADIVKTDGNYIYYIMSDEKRLFIAEIDKSKMKQVASLTIDTDYIHEMLLIGDKLCIISGGISESLATESRYYDISDRSNPILEHTLTQDGRYISSRAIGSEVYVISEFHKIEKGAFNAKTAVIPEINDKKINPENIWIPENIQNTRFTVVTAYDTNDSKENFDSAVSVIGASDTLYSGKENLYLTNLINGVQDAESGTKVPNSKTDIYRIKLGHDLTIDGTCRVAGTILNQFSMDEKDGRLRVATNIRFSNISKDGNAISSSNEQVNRVFCLNKDMEIIGQSADMGINESIKSVRFMDDIAYVVTFRQTDPLYAVDMSDPTNPTILSELKIDGFSTYMQSFTDNLLLGIGFDANSYTGAQTGLKLTMFDTTDKTNIFDISSYILKWTDGNYSSSSATYNHKAVLISASKNIIGIPLSIDSHKVVYEEGKGEVKFEFQNLYVFFEFDGKNLIEKKRVEIAPSNNTNDIRGLYIGDYSYVVSNTGIICLSLDELTVVSELTFK